jgi:nitrile hydratase
MATEPRFAPGARVRVAERQPRGHCRTPFYLSRRAGVVVSYAGRFRDPEQMAQHRPGLPMLRLYRVSFPHIGADGRPTQDEIMADLYEDWLEPESEAAP